MTKVYELILETNRDSDTVYDAWLRTFNGSDKLRYYFLDPNMYSKDLIPKALYFDGNFEMLKKYDFPYTDSRLLIVSEKVLEIFDRYSEFEFFKVPVTMFDDTFPEDRFDLNGKINESVPKMSNFIALRFPELKSYFDFYNSVYRTPSNNPKGVRGIKKLVLTEKGGKFPAIFSTREKATSIFVREDLKVALESESLNGVSFEEVQTTGNSA